MIPIYQPFLKGNEKKYVNECLESSWISSKGKFIDLFETGFSKFTGIEHSTTVANGTVALHLALKVLGVGVGDEVIVPTFTYVASVNTILEHGAIPVFVDSLEDTLQVDPEDIERKITNKTKAVMAVHLYGFACDMDYIVGICNRYNLKLIEDCAEAFGTFYKGKHVGGFGDISTFSFFGNKTITTGEGGMVCSNNKEMWSRAKHLKSQGVSLEREYFHDVSAYNYRMTNICAAIGLAQLEQVKDILEKKRQIAQWYFTHLDGLPLRVCMENHEVRSSYWMCTIILDNHEHRDKLRGYLKDNGVETRPVFPLCHEFPFIDIEQHFPIADSLSKRGINLPSFPDLTEEALKKICLLVRNYYR